MGVSLIERVVGLYGLTAKNYLPPQKGYRNTSYGVELLDGQLINIIIYKREANILDLIKRANRVGDFAAQVGLPARTTLDPRILTLKSKNTLAYACLYNYLPGKTIAWEAYTHDHLVALGKTLSDLHACLQTFQPNGPAVDELYGRLLDHMADYFVQPGVQQALANKLQLQFVTTKIAYLQRLLVVCQDLPRQQLHMDFVRGNILFTDGSEKPLLSGILDFEKTAVGSPLFDIARTLAFLLVDCKYKTAQQIYQGFLISGYARRGTMPLRLYRLRTASLLDELVQLFLVYDFYKFLRHNPYESLAQNEHFCRTRDLLLQRGYITAVNATIQSD